MTATKTRLYFSLKIFLWSQPPAFVSYIRLLFICFFSAAFSFHLARSAAWELNCGTCFAVLEKKIVCTRLWTRSASFFFLETKIKRNSLLVAKQSYTNYLVRVQAFCFIFIFCYVWFLDRTMFTTSVKKKLQNKNTFTAATSKKLILDSCALFLKPKHRHRLHQHQSYQRSEFAVKTTFATCLTSYFRVTSSCVENYKTPALLARVAT